MNPKVGDLITLKPEYRDPEEEQGIMLILGQEKEWHQTLCVEIPCYKVLTSNGSGTASWQSKSAVSHSKFVDATTASVITVGNLQFRFNTSTESLEVLSPSGFKNVQVFATKKTYTSNTSDDGTIKNYFQNENYFDYCISYYSTINYINKIIYIKSTILVDFI